MIPHLLSAGGFSCFLCFCCFLFCFFVKQALANRVDCAKGLHNSEATNPPVKLRFRNGLKHHSHATL